MSEGAAGTQIDERQARLSSALRSEVGKVLVGQDEMVEGLLVGLLCGGHILLEGCRGWPRRGLSSPLAARRSGPGFQPHPVHAGPAAGGRHRHAQIFKNPRTRRFSVKKGPDLLEPGAGRRDQPRARQGAGRPARGHAGAPGHDRRRDLPHATSPSWCSRPRTRSSRRAPTRCPRPRSIASCSRSRSATPARTRSASILDRMASGAARFPRSSRSPAATRHPGCGAPVDQLFVDEKVKQLHRRSGARHARARRRRASPSSTADRARRQSARLDLSLTRAAKAHAFLQGRLRRRPTTSRAWRRRAAPPRR